MSQLLFNETQYYFDLTEKQWWILPKSEDEWKELSNDEAYKLGLFKAVSAEQCNFIDTDVSQYSSAVSDLLKDLDNKFNVNRSNSISKCSVKSEQYVNKLLSKDFLVENVEKAQNNVKYANGEVNEANKNTDSETNVESTPEISKKSSGLEQTTKKSENEGSENILSQINNLIASTSQMKQICKAKELSAQNSAKSPTVRRTARHLTYIDNGGLAGCLKTVAEERKKMCNSKKVVSQTQNTQLQEMIQRAKAMAAKTMDEVKEVETPAIAKKAPQTKKTQLRSNAKKYTTVFRSEALKELRLNQLPDVKFELSSEEDSDEGHKDSTKQSNLKDRNQTQSVTRRSTLGR